MRQRKEFLREVPALEDELRRLMSCEIAREAQLLALGSMPAAQRVAVFLLIQAYP